MAMRIMTGIAAAAVAVMLVPAAPAEADHRGRFRIIPFFGNPYVSRHFRRVPRRYYYNEPDPFRDYEFRDGYYDPEYTGPNQRPKKKVTKKKKTVKAAASPSAAVKKKTAVAAVEPVEKTTAPTAKAASAKPVTCDKAGTIISGFGFDTVKSVDCEGQLYSFTAMRGGKPYTIKLSSVSGELTEVKKVQ